MAQHTATVHETHPEPYVVQRRWKLPVTEFIASIVIVLGAAIFLYPHVASWFSQKEQSRATAMAQEQLERPPNSDEQYRAQEIAKARQYNEALASGAHLEANANIAVGSGVTSDESLVYAELLNAGDNGFMGRIKYDNLNIDLPVYHGTSDTVLNKGVGHLEGTSLPVGGQGTRSVLTAHRGLPEATLFNELNRAEVGDTFTVSSMGEVLTYQVRETQVIEPHETEAILAEPNVDMLTLVTCTPLGINSHRILVNAERITPTPIEDLEAATAPPELPGFPWWALIGGATIIGLSIFVWQSGHRTTRSANRSKS